MDHRAAIPGHTPLPPASGSARVGRPARIDAQSIIKAALEIGLDRVTLKQVADRLDVAISTLYRHVRNRDELVRLAAFRHMSMRRLPDNAPRHWTDVAIDHAESLFESLTAEPQLISELMRGQLGPAVEADFLESFLSRICPHGFTPAQGLHLYRALAMLTLGGVIATLATRAGEHAHLPQEIAVRRMLAERAGQELPLLRQAQPEYSQLDPSGWQQAVGELLAGVALSRGEQLPQPAAALMRAASSARPTEVTAPGTRTMEQASHHSVTRRRKPK
jgi:AcrR family transcriptional regulator